MPRPIPQHNEAVNADSFLDIVASVVSIMLIMVLMVGMRIKGKPVDVPMSDEAVQAKAELDETQTVEASLRSDVLGVAAEIENVASEAEARGAERDMLAEAVTVLNYKVRTQREKLDGASRGAFDLAQRVAQSRRKLDEMAQQRDAVVRTAGPQVVIPNHPTPLSKTVDGKEGMFQLRRGRIAYIPMEMLAREMKRDAEPQLDKLNLLPEFTETVGPAGGFELQYTVGRKQFSDGSPMGGPPIPEVRLLTVIPTAENLGETADEALTDTSGYRIALTKYPSDRFVITLYVYPDSFALFRRIREDLYRQGYTVAARPLPEELQISLSPEGKKSSAQ